VVYLGERAPAAEALVFSGDHLRTGEGVATLAFSRGGLVVLDGHSTASLHSSSSGVSVGLETGKVALSLPAQRAVRVESAGLNLSPTGAFPCLAEVAVGPNGSVVVAVHRGEVSVANLRREPVVVSAGQVITVSPQVAQSQAQAAGTGAHGKLTLSEKLKTFHIGRLSHTTTVALMVAGLGGAATAAVVIPTSIRQSTVSPSTPR